MTVLRFGLTPKMKPVSPRRAAVVAGLDIGTSKIVCLIARLEPQAPQDVLRRRSHGVRRDGLRPYRRERHEGRLRGRSGRGRGNGAPGDRHRRKHGRRAARIGGGLDVRRPSGQRALRRKYRSCRRRGDRSRYRPGAGGGEPPFGARRPRRPAFAADRLCASTPRPASASRAACSATVSASICTWSPPMWRPCGI